MIPKIIHYCWFGGNPLPEQAQKCIASWRKYLPEYEIWQWSENLNDTLRYDTEHSSYDTQGKPCYDTPAATKTPLEPAERLEHPITRVMEFDVNIIPYTAEAYRQKKYAFVSDYARFWILHKYGGLYFDTDVEVIRPMNEIVANGNFMGFELDPDGENDPQKYAPRYAYAVNPGVGLGMEKENLFMKRMLEKYAQLEYETPVFPWGKTIVAYTTEELCEHGLKNIQGIQNIQGINVYPSEFFSPINIITNKLHVTEKTVSIHRFTGTWGDKQHHSWKEYVRHYMPEWCLIMINKIQRSRYKK